MQAAPTPLHELPAWVDVTAMSVGGFFGAYTAARRTLPLSAVLAAGLIFGLGGGIARDVLLGLEPAAISVWYYVPAVFAAAVVGALLAYRVQLFGNLPFVAVHAIAVGLLVTVGVQTAVADRTPGASAILIGVVAATTGWAVDDLLASRRVTLMSEGFWLLGVISLGSVVFWLVTIYIGFYPAVLTAVASMAVLRVLSVHFDWTTTPFVPGTRPPGGDP
jgi:uncharacterized membrane protein YeiH